MTTFGGWLAHQEGRTDGVGGLARYWASMKEHGHAKVRALPSVQKALTEAGAFKPGSELAPAWEQALAEWRAGPSAPAGHLSAVPPLDGGGPPAQTGLGAAGAAQDALAALRLANDRLQWLHDVLMAPEGAAPPPWPEPGPEHAAGRPVDWARASELADFDAQEAGEQ